MKQNGKYFSSVFESLKYENFRIYWSLQFFSIVGLWMQMIAQGWLVYEMTDSKFLLGLINTISGLPLLLLSPFGGILADKMNKRNLLIVTNVLFGVFSFTIGALISTNTINFINLLFIVLAIGILNAIDSPARQAFVVELIDRKSLANAIALQSLAFNGARVIGPAVAGYVIARFGVDACYYFNSAMFLLFIWALIVIKGDFHAKETSSSSVIKAFSEGYRYIKANKTVMLSLIAVGMGSLLIMPYAVLMPIFAKDILQRGAEGMGILMAFSGFGALFGAFSLAQLGNNINIRKAVLSSTFIMSASTMVFAVSTDFLLSCLMMVFMGWGIVTQAASVNTYIQNEVPNHLRGRIMSFYVMSFMGIMPLGALQAGIVSHFFGAQFSLFAGAMINVIPAMLLFLYLKTRNRKKA